jgi:cytosine/adenosine deaminase-related metal-dependent hydrolase
LYWHNFIEATGFVPATAKQRFDQALAVAEMFQPFFGPSQMSLVPHAPYSVSAKLFELIQNHQQSVTCIHSQESEAEEQFITTGKSDLLRLFEQIGVQTKHYQPEGNSSLQYAAHYLPMARNIILVHNCYTTAADIAFLRDAYALIMHQFSFCLCPNANLYIGNKLPDVPMLMKEGLRICLGTDSLASNHQLSILEEMKTLQRFFPDTELKHLLQWATANGAVALGVSEKFGHLQTGRRPGVLWLEQIGENESLKDATLQRLY